MVWAAFTSQIRLWHLTLIGPQRFFSKIGTSPGTRGQLKSLKEQSSFWWDALSSGEYGVQDHLTFCSQQHNWVFWMVIVAINPSPYNPRIGYGNWLQLNPLVNHDFPTSMALWEAKALFPQTYLDIFRHILGETWRKTQVPYSRLFSVLTFLDSISNIHTHSLYFPCFLLFKHGQLTPPSAPAPKRLLCARLLPLGCLVHLVGEGFPWDFCFFF